MIISSLSKVMTEALGFFFRVLLDDTACFIFISFPVSHQVWWPWPRVNVLVSMPLKEISVSQCRIGPDSLLVLLR